MNFHIFTFIRNNCNPNVVVRTAEFKKNRSQSFGFLSYSNTVEVITENLELLVR